MLEYNNVPLTDSGGSEPGDGDEWGDGHHIPVPEGRAHRPTLAHPQGQHVLLEPEIQDKQ